MKTTRHLLRLALFLSGILLTCGVARSATLLKYNFESGNTWTAMAGYGSPAGGGVTATPTVTNVGTADTYQSAVTSNGIQLLVNSSATTGAWTAGVDSGILSLLTTNASTNLGLLTLSFSLSASTSHPVMVRMESYNAAGTRTGGLSTRARMSPPTSRSGA